MPDSKRKTETLVGLFIFIGLATLAFLTIQFGRLGDRFIDRYELVLVFDDAAGLIKGSEVRMGGAKIGKVATTPRLNEEVKVEVVLNIEEHIKIPENSNFQIASASILGDKLIIITPPEETTGAFIGADSLLLGGGPSGLDAIQNNAEALSRDARLLLTEASSTMVKIDAAIDDFSLATRQINIMLKKVNNSVLSDDNLGHIDATIANFEIASASLEPTMTDARRAITSIENAAEDARLTFAEASTRIQELEPALKEVPGAIASLSKAANQAAKTLEQIESGNGLIGTLAYDQEVSKDAKSFIRNLKQQGILRYRDTETPEDDPRSRFRGRRR